MHEIGFIFDLDGTLLNVETVTVPAVKEAFGKFGLPPPSKKLILSGIGKVTERFYKELLLNHDESLISLIITESSKNELLFLKQGKGRLYSGVKKVLRELKHRGFRLGLVSNSNLRYFRGVIHAFALSAFFDQTLCAGETEGFRKKELVKMVKDALGVEKGIVIGDRKEDIMAAKENELQSIGCLYGYGGNAELAEADWKIRNIKELLSIVIH